MRASRAFEIASYLTLGVIVLLFVTMSVLTFQVLRGVEEQDAQIHGGYAAMVQTARLAAELSEIQRDQALSPWPGTPHAQAVMPADARPLAGAIVRAGLPAKPADSCWGPQLQCLGEAVGSLRPRESRPLALAAAGGSLPGGDEFSDVPLSPGEIDSVLDGVLERLSLEVDRAIVAESAGFQRLRDDAVLIGVIATVPGLLLFALIRRSSEAQREVAGQLAFVNDHLEHKVSERTVQLTAANAALSEHSARIQAAREEERVRIARDVHDDLGSTLTALKFELSGRCAGLAAGGSHRTWARRAATDMVDNALESVHNVIAALRPFPLDQLGLRAALYWKVGQFEEQIGIPCRLQMAEELPGAAPAVATAAYRIVEEALTNVARHAGASSVEVKGRVEDGRLVVEVSDNGRGIAAAELAAPRSFGLLSMRERARSVGGELALAAVAGRGTTVRFSLPLEEEEWATADSDC